MFPAFSKYGRSPLNHVMVIGQSLAGGAHGIPPLDTKPSRHHLMFNGGVAGLVGGFDPLEARLDERYLVPLRETISPYNVLMGQTICSSFGAWLTQKLGDGVYNLICSNASAGASAYSALSKSGLGCTISQATGIATVVSDPPWSGLSVHGLSAGRRIIISGANEPAYNISATIIQINGLQFTYAIDSTAPASATGSPRWRTMHYERGLSQVRRAMALCRSRYSVPALLCVHGEGDNNSTQYDTDIREWQSDFEGDINALTGRSGTLPVFHSQASAWNAGSGTTNKSSFAMLAEHVANPSKSPLVCPKYMMAHAADGLHMPAASYRWLGEYYAKAFHQHVIEGTQWQPLRPSAVNLSGREIAIAFTGNVGNLVLDTDLVSNPGNYGFEYTDDGASATIESVAIGSANTVGVTLNTTPTGANPRIRYAYTGVAYGGGGPTTGPRGNLRDSDTAQSLYGNTLYNWCVHFDEAL